MVKPPITLILFSLILSVLGGCSLFPGHNTYEPVNFNTLEGWSNQQAIGLKSSLAQSCKAYEKRSGPVNDNPLFGNYEQWQAICKKMASVPNDKLQAFFQQNLRVYQMAPGDNGLITGYYTPQLNGSLTKTKNYSVPMLGLPKDLVKVNNKAFRLTHPEKITGKVNNGWLIPYDSRADINRRFAKGDYNHDVVVWTDSLIDRFFFQIQGSGYVKLANDRVMYLQVAGDNGHKYYAIGRYLKQQGLSPVSMQSIRQWLDEHPAQVQTVFDKNPRFIFFKEGKNSGPTGAQGVPLTAERSVAVDRKLIPLGTPLWLETSLTATGEPWHQAVTAQDVGSAIKGPVRADIYFGAGEKAGHLAGKQNAQGKVFIMVPNPA